MPQTGSAVPTRPEYDPYDARQGADPYPTYARLRDEAPVFFSPVMNGRVLTRYDDVVAALTDTRRFSAVGSIGIDPFESFPPEVQRIFDQGYKRFPGLIEMDPPVHSAYRSLVNMATMVQGRQRRHASVRRAPGSFHLSAWAIASA